MASIHLPDSLQGESRVQPPGLVVTIVFSVLVVVVFIDIGRVVTRAGHCSRQPRVPVHAHVRVCVCVCVYECTRVAGAGDFHWCVFVRASIEDPGTRDYNPRVRIFVTVLFCDAQFADAKSSVRKSAARKRLNDSRFKHRRYNNYRAD